MGLEKRLANLSISEKPNDGSESSTRRRLPSEEEQEMFNKLVTKAKQLAGDGRVREALELNRQAFGIFESDKLAKRISKMEAYLKEFGDGEGSEENEDDDEGMVHLGNGFFLFKDLHDKLYSHQKEGVLWLWGLHQKRKGGILGDDMGLGKTIQVISFLSGMFDADKVKTVLVVLPVSLMAVWEKEIDKWTPGIKVVSYHGTSKRERERGLMKIQRRGGVCLTTYGLVVSSWDKLSQEDGREFVWDYIILDEGHKIKNPTKTSKGVRAIGAKNRIILTGTPIQNNLQELWALFDFVHHGALLGTSRTFKMEYDTPITRARERDATAGEKRLGMEMAESLKQIISPYFLRRTKAEVTAKSKEKENEVGEDEAPSKELQMPSMTRKNDFIVWLFLTDAQKKIYEDFISLEDVKALLMTHKSPLVALTVLKKLCDHPRLMSTRACMKLGLTTDEDLDEDDVENEKGLQCAANRIQFIADEMLISESGKMIFLVELLDNLKSHGHRCLVFSQSTKMLNIIQKVITNRGHRVMRLDGTVTQIADREARIQKFQRDMTYTVFLLTTQVGGVGLTLTSADRVVIFDPSWNPATDAQAVDRVFRIGQDKNVVIYRLITCGTVEEKIYRRQVFKDSITRQTTGNSKNPYRYFTKQELKELFSLDNPHFSTTQKQLEEMHGSHRSSDTTLDEHIAYLHSLNIFGISDHDLMFNVDQSRQDEGNIVDEGNDYISSRVQKAQQLLHMESSLTAEQRAQMEKPARLSDTDQTKKNKPRSPYVDPDQYQPPPPSPLRKQDLEPEVVQLDSPSPVKPRENKHQQSPPSPNSSEYQRLSSDEDDKTDESADQMEQAPDNQEMVDDIDDDSSQSENSAGQQMDAMMDEKENIATPEASRLAADSPLGDTSTVATPKASAGMLSSLISNVKNIFSPNSVNKTPIPLNHSVNVLNDSTSSHNNAIPRTPVSDVQVKSEKMTPKTPVMLYQTPSRGLPKTPDLQRVTHEEIIISPDPSRPIIKMEPVTPEDRQPVCPPRRVRHNSNDPIHFVLEPSPEPPRRSPVSHISNRSLHMTIVEDSPEPSELPSYRQSVKDRRLSRLSISNRFVQDSAENSPAVEMESSENSPNVVNMVTESDLEVVEDSGPEEMDESSIVTDQLHEPMRSSVSEEIGEIDTPTGVSETPLSAAGSRQKSAGRRRSVASKIPPANSKTGLVETPRSSVGTKQKSSNRRRSVSAKVVPKRISSDESFDSNDGDFEENIPGGSNKASNDGKKLSSKYQSSKSSKERRDEDNSESDVSLDDMDSPVQKKPTRRNKCAIQSSPEEPSPKSAQKGSLRKKRGSLPSAKDADLRRQLVKGARNSASKNHNSKKANISRNNRVAAGNKNSRRTKVVQSEDSENELNEKNNSSHRTDVNKSKAFGGAGEEVIDSEGEITDNSEGEATDNSEGEATDNSKEETIDNSEDEASDNSEGEAVENSEEEESEEEDQNEEGSEDSFIDDEGASDEDFSGEEEYSEGEEDRGSSRGAGNRGDGRHDGRGTEGEGSMPKHVMEKFAKLEFKAGKLFNRGQYEQALVPMLQALDIYPDPYMQAMVLKIHKMTKNKKKK